MIESNEVNQSDTNYMITTLDNPWNPFTHFDEWMAFDISHGYDTCGTLARFANLGNNLSNEENSRIINEAMDDMMEVDVKGLWIKVSRESFESIKNKLGSEKVLKILETK